MAITTKINQNVQLSVISAISSMAIREYAYVLKYEAGVVAEPSQETKDAKAKMLKTYELLAKTVGWKHQIIFPSTMKQAVLMDTMLEDSARNKLLAKLDTMQEENIEMPSADVREKTLVDVDYDYAGTLLRMVQFQVKGLWSTIVRNHYGIWKRKDGTSISLSEGAVKAKLVEIKQWLRITNAIGIHQDDVLTREDMTALLDKMSWEAEEQRIDAEANFCNIATLLA